CSTQSAEMRCFQDFRSSDRLWRSAPRRIPFRRSGSTDFECAVPESMGYIRERHGLYIRRVSESRGEALDVREIKNVFCMVLQNDGDTCETGLDRKSTRLNS